MNWRWAAVISVIAASAVAVQGHAATLDLRGAVARVIVVTEPRTDIKATLLSPNPRLPLNIAREGDKVVVSGSPSLTPWWLKMSGGLDCLNRDRRWLSGIAAGCVSPWLALHAGRA